MTPNNEINALVHLIEDPDPDIFLQIKEKILDYGVDIVPHLESAWEKNEFGEKYQKRLENLIHELQFKDICNSLKGWLISEEKNLLDGVFLINRYQYPDLQRSRIEAQIELIKRDALFEIEEKQTGFEKVQILNHLIFDIHQFSGNKKDYYAPRNSLLNEVLDNKKGNALMLSVIYLEVARRLNIPIEGINLPNHFVLGYKDVNGISKEFKDNDQTGILFYINTFSRGAILHKKEIDEFLNKINIPAQPRFYVPCSNVDIVKRVLTNLLYSYSQMEQANKIQEIQILLKIIEDHR